LFMAMLLYFFTAAFIIRKMTFVAKYEALMAAEMSAGCENYHPGTTETELQVLAMLKSIQDFNFLEFERVFVAKYHACHFNEAMEELIDFKPRTWFALGLLSVIVGKLCTALQVPVIIVFVGTWIAYSVPMFIMMKHILTLKHLTMQEKKTLKDIHSDSLNSLDSRCGTAHMEKIIYRTYEVVTFFCGTAHMEKIIYRTYKVVTFFGCYIAARTMFSRYLWIHHPRVVAAIAFVNVCIIAVASLLVMPPVIFNFSIAMGLPPHFGSCNQKLMKQIIEKYPKGPKKIELEGEINSKDDLPSSKLMQEYYRKNPWAKYELNIFRKKAEPERRGDLEEPLNPQDQ